MESRKEEHLKLAFESQTEVSKIDNRFHYEPMLSSHPENELKPFTFLNKEFRIPIWISSITGGTQHAAKINRNLARACKEFGMGMGLGSCRIIMNENTFFEDFNMRPLIGDMPLWANLGIAQIENIIAEGQVSLASNLIKRLDADGLIIHVNPMQEWLQPEGNILKHTPLETIKRFLEKFNYPVIVKEVGQGIGPESLKQLLQLPLQAIEFAAFGGTNFAKTELLRNKKKHTSHFEPLSYIGEDALSMVESVNTIIATEKPVCKELIISGGIRNFLDGYYLMKKSNLPAVYGMASSFLKYAQDDYEQLRNFIAAEIKGLEMAYAFLRINQ